MCATAAFGCVVKLLDFFKIAIAQLCLQTNNANPIGPIKLRSCLNIVTLHCAWLELNANMAAATLATVTNAVLQAQVTFDS